MRTKLFAALMEAPVSYFDAQHLGRFSNGLTIEAERAATAVMQLLTGLVAVMLIAVYMAAAVIISWQLSLVAIGFLGAFALVARRTGSLKRRGVHMTQANTALKTTTIEYLSAVREVSALGLDDHARQVFTRVARAVAREAAAIERIIASFRTIYEIAAVVVITALLGIAVGMLDIQTAAVVAFLILLFRLSPRLILLQSSMYQYLSAAPGYGELESLHAEAEQNRTRMRAGVPITGFNEAIEFRGVTFTYDGHRNALDGINLRVQQGTTVGIIGGSGAGKSTLANLLLRFNDPTSGSLLVDGIDLREVDIDSWRSMIGFVGQESFLFHESIAHNIALGNPAATPTDIRTAATQAGAHVFIAELPDGYDTAVGDRGVLLSGGQRQRLALARALIRDPQVLLLDEATSDLDARTQSAVQQAIREVHGKRTVIVVAHRLSTIRDSDLIVVLENGKIVETGDHDSLLRAAGHYAEYYAAEAGE
jgi:ABC-type multidrug transport system fused ATPase/permease subunit